MRHKYSRYAYCNKRRNKLTFNLLYECGKDSLLFGIIMTGLNEIKVAWVICNGKFIEESREQDIIKEYYEDIKKHGSEIYKKYYKL